MEEPNVRQSVEWLKKRVPIDDVYTPHLIFIMRDFAEKYHEAKLKENETRKGNLGNCL